MFGSGGGDGIHHSFKFMNYIRTSDKALVTCMILDSTCVFDFSIIVLLVVIPSTCILRTLVELALSLVEAQVMVVASEEIHTL